MRKPTVHYAWIMAVITFAVLLVGAGIRATPGILIVPLEREFGWNRATTSAAVSLGLLLYGLVGPFCAAIAQRAGVRRTMAFALAVLAIAVLLATRIREPWQLVLLWGLFVGTGTGMVATVLGAVVVNRWFSHRRGMVLGALTASTATGQLVFLPILARLVEHHGWRAALYLVGGAALAAIPLALLFVKESPDAMGLLPYGMSAGEPLLPPRQGNPAAVALRTLGRAAHHRDFWLLAGTFFVCGASTNGLIGAHLIPACMDHGIPEVRAAGLLAAMGIFNLFGTTFSGWLSDRWDNRKLLFSYYFLRGISLVLLPDALHHQGPELSVFTVFYGLDWIATVPPTVKLATDAFGKDDGSNRLRLDHGRAPDRRRGRSPRRRDRPDRDGRVPAGVPLLWRALPPRGIPCHGHREEAPPPRGGAPRKRSPASRSGRGNLTRGTKDEAPFSPSSRRSREKIHVQGGLLPPCYPLRVPPKPLMPRRIRPLCSRPGPASREGGPSARKPCPIRYRAPSIILSQDVSFLSRRGKEPRGRGLVASRISNSSPGDWRADLKGRGKRGEGADSPERHRRCALRRAGPPDDLSPPSPRP